MALVESTDIPLNTPIIPFSLPDPDGKVHTQAELMGKKGLLIAFTCNHCPYAIAVWPRLIRLAQYASQLGINTVGINPNIHPGYLDDAPPKMKEKIKEWGISFPYLVDETQKTAKAYKAQCTPDLYLFGADGKLAYHGRIDDNWKEEEKVTRQELKEAIDALAAGKPVNPDQKPSMGCSIKWK